MKNACRSELRSFSRVKVRPPSAVKLPAYRVRHAEAAYRRGDLLDQRRDLMTAWSAFVTSTELSIITA